MRVRGTTIAALSLLALPGVLIAHPGHGPHGFAGGAVHPLSGVDHLLAMIAVGMWASQWKGKSVVIVPLAFVSAMLLGGVIAAAGFALPFVEAAIATSVLVLGLLVAFVRAMPLPMSASLVALFALFHGQAHFAEMPAGSSPAAYAAGFAVASVALQVLGATSGFTIAHRSVPSLGRTCGCIIAAVGAVLVALTV